MKSQSIGIIVLLLASTHSVAFDINLRGINKKNADEVMPELTSMMQAAQTSLAKAQHHHKKVIAKVRREVVHDFDDEANNAGRGLGSFAAQLEEAAQEIEHVVNVTKSGLSELESKAKNINSWEDPEMQKRASLNAQVGAAEQTVHKMRRHSARAVRAAEERAESSLEDSSEKLSMKLGDLSDEYQTAKNALESNVSAAQTNYTTSNGSSAPKKVGQNASLDTLEKNLKETVKTSQAAISFIEKRIDSFLDQVDKEVMAKQNKVEKTMQVAVEKELNKYVGHPTISLPATSTQSADKNVKVDTHKVVSGNVKVSKK